MLPRESAPLCAGTCGKRLRARWLPWGAGAGAPPSLRGPLGRPQRAPLNAPALGGVAPGAPGKCARALPDAPGARASAPEPAGALGAAPARALNHLSLGGWHQRLLAGAPARPLVAQARGRKCTPELAGALGTAPARTLNHPSFGGVAPEAPGKCACAPPGRPGARAQVRPPAWGGPWRGPSAPPQAPQPWGGGPKGSWKVRLRVSWWSRSAGASAPPSLRRPLGRPQRASSITPALGVGRWVGR